MFNALAKRGIQVDQLMENGTLVQRDMTLPKEGEDLEKYMMRETDNDNPNPTIRRLH